MENSAGQPKLPVHVKLCSAIHNNSGIIQTLLQKDKKQIPQRFDFDVKKLFYAVDQHWQDFYKLKKAQAHNSCTFDPYDLQNFTYTFDTNDDFSMIYQNLKQQDENQQLFP